MSHIRTLTHSHSFTQTLIGKENSYWINLLFPFPVKKAPTIKIASWNIANFTADSRHKQYPEIAKLIENFDIVALQEVLELEVLIKMKEMMPGKCDL